jgi:hypothetical protein
VIEEAGYCGFLLRFLEFVFVYEVLSGGNAYRFGANSGPEVKAKVKCVQEG